MVRRKIIVLAGVVIIAAAGAVAVALGRDSDTLGNTMGKPTSKADYASPTGRGNCSKSSPCSVSTAVARAEDGGIVVITRGSYGETELVGNKRRKPVTITSDPGARFVDTLRVKAPDLDWRGLTLFHANLSFTGDRSTVTKLHLIGGNGVGTVFVRADDVTIKDSLIEGGVTHDGMNIAASTGDYQTNLPAGCGRSGAKPCATVNQNTVLDRVTVRDIGDVPGTANHSDCIQIYDTAHATIQNSTIYNCDNGAIQTSPGLRHGIWGLTIKGNFISRCATPAFSCRGGGGAALDLRANTSVLRDLTLDHNTVASGSVRFPVGNPVKSARFNIVSSIAVARPCTTPLADSLIAQYPRGLDCTHVPGATLNSTNGNVLGALPSFVDSTRGNLRLSQPLRNAPVDRQGDVTDRDGHRIKSVGADGYGG